jgi:hypothetical protein
VLRGRAEEDEIGGGWNIEREEGTRTGGTQIIEN